MLASQRLHSPLARPRARFEHALVALPLTLGLLSACGDDTQDDPRDSAVGQVTLDDAGADAASEQDAAGGEASASVPDAGAIDAERPADDAAVASDASSNGDACGDAGCATADPFAPFQLDCADLPSNGTCQGGPREVLLVTEDKGLVAMFDPVDGHFLGYLKRPAASYYVDNVADYWQATQGPDQCIWTVSEHDDAQVQRWNTDGSYRDAPLAAQLLPSATGIDDPAIQDPVAIAFSEDRLFVASSSGDPHPRLTRWKLDGTFDGTVLDDGSSVSSLLPLRDGSLLVSDRNQRRVARIAAGSQEATPILGGLDLVGQIWYAGDGKLLVSDNSSGTALHEVVIATGAATTVRPATPSVTNKYGVAALKNGNWLVAGGSFHVSSLDPRSSNPAGQYQRVWTDNAVDSVTFYNIGRACLPEQVVANRAPRPPENSCLAAPAGPYVLREDFEGTGNFEGTGSARHYKSFYDRAAPGVTSSIDATGGSNGSRALRIVGAGRLPIPGGRTRGHKTGVYTSLAAAQPSYVSYRVKVGPDYEYWLGFFALQNAAANTGEYERLAGTYFDGGYLRSLESNASSYPTVLDERWLQIELRNIDWSTRTYDLYVDCSRLAERVALPAGMGDSVDLLDLYNVSSMPGAETVSWYDDILIK